MINPELGRLIDPQIIKSEEERLFVPVGFGHRRLHELVIERHPTNLKLQGELMAKYSPLAEWLAQPRTIEKFTNLKWSLLSLAWKREGEPWELDTYKGSDLDLYIFEDRGYGVRRYVTDDYRQWKRSVMWTLLLAERMRILDYRRIKAGKKIKDWKWSIISSLGYKIEGRGPKTSSFIQEHSRLDIFGHQINYAREHFVEDHLVSRVGMIIGDFRIGDHSAHGRLIQEAKTAVGKHGWLVVVAPSRKTILNTTDKTKVWEDEERLYRLRSNRYIDHIFFADMPEEDYGNPGRYWRKVWRYINPDLVFLGEKNHPLEGKYRIQSQHLGGILLIDDSPVIVRSGELIKQS